MLLAGIALVLIGATLAAQENRQAEFEQKGWKRLDAAAIRGAVLDATFYPDGKGYQVYVAPDGKMKFKSFLGWTDVGKGEVTSDGLFCRQWNHVRSGTTLCTSMWKKGNTYMSVREDGQVFRTLVIERGNPDNL